MTARRMVAASMLAVLLCAASLGAHQEWEAASREAVLRADWHTVTQIAQRWQQREAQAAIAHWLLAYAGLALGNYHQALEGFSQLDTAPKVQAVLDYTGALVHHSPQNAIAQLLRGDALARTGKYVAALAALDEAVRLAPRLALLYDVRGVVCALAGKTAAASADLEHAIALQPTFADAYANLGRVRLQQEDLDGAVDALTRALALAPAFALAHNARGTAWLGMEEWDAARQAFVQARHLAPTLPWVASNLAVAERAKARVELQSLRLQEEAPRHGTTRLAQAYEHRVVNVGGGRTLDYVVITATPQTATLDGMRAVMQAVPSHIRTQSNLPPEWQPQRVLVSLHAVGSSPYVDMRHAVTLGQHAGADLVVALDTRPWFQPGQVLVPHGPAGESPVVAATHFVARANAAINLEWKVAPSAIAPAQAGWMATVKLGELYETGQLAPEVAQALRWQTVVLTGASPPTLQVPSKYEAERLEAILNFTTPAQPPLLDSQPLGGSKVVNVPMTDLGRPVPPTQWNNDRWESRPNPVPELAGWFIQGVRSPQVLQAYAWRLGELGEVPIYATAANRPLSEALLLATASARGLRPGDKVLIGGLDAERVKAIAPVVTRGGGQVDWKPEADPAKLQALAKAEGSTHILLDGPEQPDAVSSVLSEAARKMPAAPLPSLKPLAKNLDRFSKAVWLLYKLVDAKMPLAVEAPLELTGPVLLDFQDAQLGQFHPWMSHTLERVSKFGLKQIVDKLIENGKLPPSYKVVLAGLPDIMVASGSQIGRGQWTASIEELTQYLDGFNKVAWAIVGYLLAPADKSKGAAIAAKTADLVAEWVREETEGHFQKWMHSSVRRQVLQNWRAQVETAMAYGLPVKPLTEMYSAAYLQQIGLDPKRVAELAALDNLARWAHVLSRPAPIDSLQNEAWKKFVIFPPHRFDAVPVPNDRLPSAVLSGQPEDERGGVLMTAEVVKNQPADTSALFGGSSSQQPATAPPEGLVAPFLLFSAVMKGK